MWQSHLAGCTHSLRRSCSSHKCCSAPKLLNGNHSAALFHPKAAACRSCLHKSCIRGVHCRRVAEAFGLPPFLDMEEQHQPEEPSAEHEEAANPAAAVRRAEDAVNVLQVGVGHVRHGRVPSSGLKRHMHLLGRQHGCLASCSWPDTLLAAADLSKAAWSLAPCSVPQCPVLPASCLWRTPAVSDMPQRPAVDTTRTACAGLQPCAQALLSSPKRLCLHSSVHVRLSAWPLALRDTLRMEHPCPDAGPGVCRCDWTPCRGDPGTSQRPYKAWKRPDKACSTAAMAVCPHMRRAGGASACEHAWSCGNAQLVLPAPCSPDLPGTEHASIKFTLYIGSILWQGSSAEDGGLPGALLGLTRMLTCSCKAPCEGLCWPGRTLQGSLIQLVKASAVPALRGPLGGCLHLLDQQLATVLCPPVLQDSPDRDRRHSSDRAPAGGPAGGSRRHAATAAGAEWQRGSSL